MRVQKARRDAAHLVVEIERVRAELGPARCDHLIDHRGRIPREARRGHVHEVHVLREHAHRTLEAVDHRAPGERSPPRR